MSKPIEMYAVFDEHGEIEECSVAATEEYAIGEFILAEISTEDQWEDHYVRLGYTCRIVHVVSDEKDLAAGLLTKKECLKILNNWPEAQLHVPTNVSDSTREVVIARCELYKAAARRLKRLCGEE